MLLSRRNLLRGASATALGVLALPRRRAWAAGRMANPLKIPPLLEGTAGPTGKLYELNVAAGNSSFLPSLTTPTLGINGPYLGPTIRCQVGDKLALRVKNNLTEPTALHWHGLHIPA